MGPWTIVAKDIDTRWLNIFSCGQQLQTIYLPIIIVRILVYQHTLVFNNGNGITKQYSLFSKSAFHWHDNHAKIYCSLQICSTLQGQSLNQQQKDHRNTSTCFVDSPRWNIQLSLTCSPSYTVHVNREKLFRKALNLDSAKLKLSKSLQISEPAQKKDPLNNTLRIL